jgi:hypothetical protein
VMLGRVRIIGDGVAACCCARLLRKDELAVTLDPQSRPRVPALLLNQSSQSLLRDTFADPALLAGLHSIHRRIVVWGPSAEPKDIPHSGLVASEALLVDRLWNNAPIQRAAHAPADWTILSAGDASAFGVVRRFGSRTAVASEIVLKSNAPQDACWIESLENGWLFLLCSGNSRALLLAIGHGREELLAHSRIIANQIDSCENDSPPFPVYPRILSPLSGAGWLACGTAAIGFDPICGEGVGNALREAILVTASLRAFLNAQSAQDPCAVLMHYSSRLLSGFLWHLRTCIEYYTLARCSGWWDQEIEMLQQGVAWTECELKKCPSPRYRLVDFDLQEVSGGT